MFSSELLMFAKVVTKWMSVVWWLPTKGKVDKACRNNYRTTFCIIITE